MTFKRPKYRNTRITVDGIKFDSKAEARRWNELKLLERAGEITKLERQIRFPLLSNGEKIGHYVADFGYFTKEARVVEDVKSPATASTRLFQMKKKMMKAQYGIDVVVTK